MSDLNQQHGCAATQQEPPCSPILFPRFVEELHQLIFPERGKGVAAVAAGFVAHWHDDGAAVRDALDLALEDTELGRVDQVVGKIDRE